MSPSPDIARWHQLCSPHQHFHFQCSQTFRILVTPVSEQRNTTNQIDKQKTTCRVGSNQVPTQQKVEFFRGELSRSGDMKATLRLFQNNYRVSARAWKYSPSTKVRESVRCGHVGLGIMNPAWCPHRHHCYLGRLALFRCSPERLALMKSSPRSPDM
jgi:hypothetical protein